MSAWLAWVIAAAALVGGEVLTMGLFLGPLALAAGAAASLGLLRPFALRHLRHGPRLRSGTQALIGERALVLDRVDLDGGRVKIGGEIWSARCMSEDEVIEPGERAVVIE